MLHRLLIGFVEINQVTFFSVAVTKHSSSSPRASERGYLLLPGISAKIFLPDNQEAVSKSAARHIHMFWAKGRKSMTIRTTRTTVSFSQPFKLKDLDDIQPAGDYLLDTDEELIEGLSRLAYRRVATLLHLPSTFRPQSSRTEVVLVSPAELDAALERDRSGRA
jgi:hypothetical protein